MSTTRLPRCVDRRASILPPARQAPVPRGPMVHSAWRRLGSSVDSKLCHCQFCVSWVTFPRQSRVAARNTAVQHSCFAVVVRSISGFLHLSSSSFSGSQSRSSPHPATMKSSPCSTMSKSRDGYPNAHGQLFELSKPMSAPTFRMRCCHPASAKSVPYIHFFRSQHCLASVAVSRTMGA